MLGKGRLVFDVDELTFYRFQANQDVPSAGMRAVSLVSGMLAQVLSVHWQTLIEKEAHIPDQLKKVRFGVIGDNVADTQLPGTPLKIQFALIALD